MSEWMPIETAPDETDVLLHIDGRPPAVAGRFRGTWTTFDSKSFQDDEPTHWMPLPTPPQGV